MPCRISSALSKKRSRSSEACSSEEKLTATTSIRWYTVALFSMNHVELGCEPEEALRVADEEIALGIQAAMELVDEPLLLRLVEIDHHVAAENDVVALRQIFRFQIVKIELHEILERRPSRRTCPPTLSK